MSIILVKTSYDLVWIISFIWRLKEPLRSVLSSLLSKDWERCKFCVVLYVCMCVCWPVYVRGPYLLVHHICASKMLSWIWQLWCDGVCSGTDPDQRSFYLWIQTAYTEHIMPPTEQDTCNRPLTWSHLESLSSSLKAGANPCGVYHTTGTTAGWSVCSLSWTSWWGWNIWILSGMMCPHLDFDQWASPEH